MDEIFLRYSEGLEGGEWRRQPSESGEKTSPSGFPGEVAKAAQLRDGEHVEIAARDGDIVIRRRAPRFVLEELFCGKSPEEWRALYREAFDWGCDIGREVVEE